MPENVEGKQAKVQIRTDLPRTPRSRRKHLPGLPNIDRRREGQSLCHEITFKNSGSQHLLLVRNYRPAKSATLAAVIFTPTIKSRIFLQSGRVAGSSVDGHPPNLCWRANATCLDLILEVALLFRPIQNTKVITLPHTITQGSDSC